MKIERLDLYENDNSNVSPTKFKRVEDGLKSAAYWIKNPEQKSKTWKDEIFCYPDRVKLEDARAGKSWSSRSYTVHPNYKRKTVFVENSRSTQWELSFDSETEMSNWLNNVIVAEKYDMYDMV